MKVVRIHHDNGKWAIYQQVDEHIIVPIPITGKTLHIPLTDAEKAGILYDCGDTDNATRGGYTTCQAGDVTIIDGDVYLCVDDAVPLWETIEGDIVERLPEGEQYTLDTWHPSNFREMVEESLRWLRELREYN